MQAKKKKKLTKRGKRSRWCNDELKETDYTGPAVYGNGIVKKSSASSRDSNDEMPFDYGG